MIRGDWGNGTERKNRLTAAGYDYSAVQSLVNQLVGGGGSGGSSDSGGGGSSSGGGSTTSPPVQRPKNYEVYETWFYYKDKYNISTKTWGAMAAETMRRITNNLPLNIWIGTKYPNNFDPTTIYIVYGGSGEDGNPYYQVRNSCLINNRGVMYAVIDFIIEFNSRNPLSMTKKFLFITTTKYWNRTPEGMYIEWLMHNAMYYRTDPTDPNKIRYRDVDFDMNGLPR